MNNKKYQTPQADFVKFSTEDIMSLSINFSNLSTVEDNIDLDAMLL